MIRINSYSIEDNEYLYGPGKRLLLFLQGCTLKCKGCVNKHLWDFHGGYEIEDKDIISLCDKLDGITLHGGEPLDQAELLLNLVNLLKKDGKTIVLFTGYTYKETNKAQRKIWHLADIVVAGRYIESQRNIYLQFRGSTNQKIYKHNGKYKNYKVKDGKNVSLFNITKDGFIDIKGFQSEELNKIIEYFNIYKR